MRILICDDNLNDIENLSQCIHIFFQEKNIDYKINTCDNKNDFFNNIRKYDLIFLDIELGNDNGIKMGLELRKHIHDARIIITSNYSKYLIDGYKIQADRYFIKPIKQDEFSIEMENVLYRYYRQYFGIEDSKLSNSKIYLNDILYIEYYDRKTVLHLLSNKTIIAPYRLKYWIRKLENYSFGQPHKSYLVNYTHISGFSNQDIILINEELIPLSRYFKKEFLKKYADYQHKVF